LLRYSNEKKTTGTKKGKDDGKKAEEPTVIRTTGDDSAITPPGSSPQVARFQSSVYNAKVQLRKKKKEERRPIRPTNPKYDTHVQDIHVCARVFFFG